MRLYRPTFIAGCLALTATVAVSQDAKKETNNPYMVVVNHEEQYSVWPQQKTEGTEWRVAVESCGLDACHDYIEEVWTDMRPLSLRKEMADEKLDAGKAKFRIIVNHEEQYSVVLAESDVPKGWKSIGKAGSLAECQDQIEEVWTDMRPLSMRKH